MFIDIHTHHSGITAWAIQNLYKDFEQVYGNGRYSLGLHPWYINRRAWMAEMELLKLRSRQENVLAIGECGLDKVCKTDFSLQEEVFIAQVNWANQINKPIIIHCVRAYEEVMKLLQQVKNKVPVIFHGFNKKIGLAEKIVQEGYLISFGKALQHENVQSVLKVMPTDQIFLETDDAAITIQEIYQLTAGILQIDTNELSLQIQKNAATVLVLTY